MPIKKMSDVVAAVTPNDQARTKYLDLANQLSVSVLGDRKEVVLTTRQHEILSEAAAILRELAHDAPDADRQSLSGESVLTIADQVIETYLPVSLRESPNTFAISLGFMECFADYARKKFGNYEDVLLDGYYKMFKQEAIFAVVPGDEEALIDIARKGREVIVRTLHATMFKYGTLAPSMTEQVQMLQFLLEAPSKLCDESKALVRTFEEQVQRCKEKEHGVGER